MNQKINKNQWKSKKIILRYKISNKIDTKFKTIVKVLKFSWVYLYKIIKILSNGKIDK